jgi:hypothetical protein
MFSNKLCNSKGLLNQDMTAACWVAPKIDSPRNQNQFWPEYPRSLSFSQNWSSQNHKKNCILGNSLIFDLAFKHNAVDALILEQQLKIIYVPWTLSYYLATIQSSNPNYQSQPKLIEVHVRKHNQWIPTAWSTASPKCSFCHYTLKVKPTLKS